MRTANRDTRRRVFPVLERLEDRTLLSVASTALAAASRPVFTPAAAARPAFQASTASPVAGTQFVSAVRTIIDISETADGSLEITIISNPSVMSSGNAGMTAASSAAQAAATQPQTQQPTETTVETNVKIETLLVVPNLSAQGVVVAANPANGMANNSLPPGAVAANLAANLGGTSALVAAAAAFESGPHNNGSEGPGFLWQDDQTRPGVPDDATLQLLLGSPVVKATPPELFKPVANGLIRSADCAPEANPFAQAGIVAANQTTTERVPLHDGVDTSDSAQVLRRESASRIDATEAKLVAGVTSVLDASGVDLPALRQRVEQHLDYLATQPDGLLGDSSSTVWMSAFLTAGLASGEFWRQASAVEVDQSESTLRRRGLRAPAVR
jgi:hypothetical protein